MKYDSAYSESINLSDGRSVLLRLVRSDDKPLFQDAIRRSSLRTVYGRFLTPKAEFSAAELAYLTEADGVGHLAIGAASGDVGVGVGRLIASGEEAEIALAVDDDFQGAGLGSALLDRLLEAAFERGVRIVSCLALASNEAAAGLFRRLPNVSVRSLGELVEFSAGVPSPRK